MTLSVIRRCLAAAIWGPSRATLEGERLELSGECPETGEAMSVASPDDPGSVLFVYYPGSVLFVCGDGDRPPGKPDSGVGVADQAGKPTPIDHDMAACSRPGAFRDIFRNDSGGFCLEVSNRPPWNPEGEL